MIHLKRIISRHVIKVLSFILLFSFAIVQFGKINNWIFVKGPEELKGLFDGFGNLSIIIFIIIYIVANILLTPSYPFVFVSGIVYGLFWGTIISLIGELLSATINFFLGRKIDKTFFVHKLHHKKINFVKKYIEKHGFTFILIMRYLGFYFDIISYAAGMTKIKFNKFIIATFIGFIPYILIYAYAGNQLMDIRSSSFIYPLIMFKAVLFGTFAIGYILYEYQKNGKKIKQFIYNNKISIIAILSIIFIIHAYNISNGYTSYFYERFRDFFISIIALIFCVYYARLSIKKNKDWASYLVIANLFMLIFAIHILRLMFGGLPC